METPRLAAKHTLPFAANQGFSFCIFLFRFTTFYLGHSAKITRDCAGCSELPKAAKATAQGAAQFEDSDALAESRTPTLA